MNTSTGDSERQPQRLLPPRWIWIWLGVCGLLIALVRYWGAAGSAQWFEPLRDRAHANILTLIISFVATMTLLVWYLFFSGFSKSLRLTTWLLGIGCVVIFFLVFRIEDVTGNLIPRFTLRWANAPDEDMQQPIATETTADLATTTPDDFPQFLGPKRLAAVDQIQLNPNWSTHSPRQIWQQGIGAGWSGFAVVNGFAVTMEQRGSNELTTCYDVQSGDLVWSHAIRTRHNTKMGGTGPRSTPTIADGKVYSLGATGWLHCLKGVDGQVIWSCNIPEIVGSNASDDLTVVQWGRSASPLIVDDLVIIPGGGPPGGEFISLIAFQKDTGNEIWRGGGQQISYSSPNLVSLAGRQQILTVNESSVAGHAPTTGDELWRYQWPGSSTTNANVSQAVPVGDDRVFLSKAYGGGGMLLQIDKMKDQTLRASEIWARISVMKTKFTNVVIYRDSVFGLSDGRLDCIDVNTGKRRWQRGRYANYGHGQILRVGDLLLIQGEDGSVAMVKTSTDQFRELGRFNALSGKTWNNPALYKKYLLVRNSLEAACYELTIHH